MLQTEKKKMRSAIHPCWVSDEMLAQESARVRAEAVADAVHVQAAVGHDAVDLLDGQVHGLRDVPETNKWREGGKEGGWDADDAMNADFETEIGTF